jgi:hypothetical protein
MIKELLYNNKVKLIDKLRVVALYCLRYENKSSQWDQFRITLENLGASKEEIGVRHVAVVVVAIVVLTFFFLTDSVYQSTASIWRK